MHSDPLGRLITPAGRAHGVGLRQAVKVTGVNGGCEWLS